MGAGGVPPALRGLPGQRSALLRVAVAQIAILVLLVVVVVRMHGGKSLIGPRLILPVTIVGCVYFSVMAVRLVLGLSVLSHSGWFSTWIPTMFHLVLAGLVTLIAAYQRFAR